MSTAKRTWSVAEKSYLANVADLTLPQIIAGLKAMASTPADSRFSEASVSGVMRRNGWKYKRRNKKESWDDPEDENFIVRNLATMTRAEIATDLDRSVTSITARIQKLRKQGRLPARVRKIKTVALQEVVVQVTNWLVVDGNETNVEFLKREKKRLSRSVVKKDGKGRKALFRVLTKAA